MVSRAQREADRVIPAEEREKVERYAKKRATKLGTTLNAALVLDITFLVGAAIVVAVVVGWQRAHGETVRDLGWRAPTRPVAIVVAIIWGLIWTSSGYARGGHPLQEFLTFSWPTITVTDTWTGRAHIVVRMSSVGAFIKMLKTRCGVE